MLSKVKVFVPVDGGILPEKSGNYLIISEDIEDGDQQEDTMYFDGEKWSPNYPQFKAALWLKESEMYCFSKEQLENVLRDSFGAGKDAFAYEIGDDFEEGEIPAKDFKEYINQIFK